MRNRIEDIKSKGFNIIQGRVTEEPQSSGYQGINFNKVKVGAQTLNDAIYDLGTYKKVNPRYADKGVVLKAIDSYDLKSMRKISDFYYKANGIYARILRYMAFMYKYDWFLTPFVNDDNLSNDRVMKNFYKALNILDRMNIKKKFGDIALKVLRYGAYYGYKVETGDKIAIQELPPNYCRSRYFGMEDKPIVEFNMKFFDEQFTSTGMRMKILKLFPAEFAKGYHLYKQGKLPPEYSGDTSGWYLLDPEKTVKFTATGEDYPMFISVIPLIIDLDEAQELDKKKTLQRLLKIIIQKMPLDKNGELIFDVDEARQLHNNAVQMLGKAIGIDVLTTFAEVEVANMAESSALSAQSDDLQRVERQVYNQAGIAQSLFNTDSNLALEKSVLNDSATMLPLIHQLEQFLCDSVKRFNKGTKLTFQVRILPTTIYNYIELSKVYKEQVTMGFNKLLPAIALGQSQSAILANLHFENEIIVINDLLQPPLTSSVLSGKVQENTNDSKDVKNKSKGNTIEKEEDKGGRPELDDDKKSAKTIANKESM